MHALKLKWHDCEIIAERLEKEITKHNVFSYLYDDLKKKGLLERALDINDVNIVAEIKELETFKRMKEGELGAQVNIHDPESQDLTKAAKLKVALWFIDKIGNVEEAKNVIDAAALALKKLRNNEK